jgi:glycosyltransferase involved in cell wall biosynthesis
MYGEKTMGVVVPAHDEERLIGQVIETMPDFVDRIIIVDDKSGDSTAEVVAGYVRQMPERVRLIRHERNGGVGKATVTGYRAALEEELELVAVMNGDAQMDPEDLAALVEPVASGEADYAKGNRLFTDQAWNVVPKVRYLGNSALSLMTKVTSGYWHIADSQTGYTVISRRALETIDLDHLWPSYGFPNDMLVNLNVYGFTVVDMPVRPVYGVGEKSGMRIWKVIPTISWLLFRRFWWRLFHKYVIHDTHPLVLFYVTGMLAFVLGLLLGLQQAYYRWVRGIDVAVPTVVLVAILLMSGLQMLFFAMWFDMDYNKEQRR